METQEIVFLAGGVGGCIVIYLSMWAMSLRMRKPALRSAGLRIALFGLAAIGIYAVTANERTNSPADFDTEVPGPASGEGSTLREVKFPVTDLGARQFVELTMKSATMAEGELGLRCKVVDPEGNQLASFEQRVSPGEGRTWLPMLFDFHAEYLGDHKLLVQIPQNVDMMRVVVRELK